MAIIKLSVSERRRLSVFFTCLVLAFGAWMLATLSTQYNYTVKKVIVFTDAPLKRSFRSLQSDTVEATVQGNGWHMLFSRMNIEDNTINVNLKTLDNKSYVVVSSQLKRINEKRPPNQQFVSFIPDTLYFDFSSRAVKRVPVQLQYRIGFKQQFSISDNMVIKPDYVMLSGPADVINKINTWKTDSMIIKGAEDTVYRTVPLQKVKESNMSVYPKVVQVNVPVDEFTEKTLEIPVRLINNKSFYNVKVFPQKVKVTFTIPLGRYTETNEAFFEAVADLSMWQQQGYKQLPVKLLRLPAFSKLVRIEPQNIDFIVKE
jgi:hypothetical protein